MPASRMPPLGPGLGTHLSKERFPGHDSLVLSLDVTYNKRSRGHRPSSLRSL
uniref:Uncharacterized protein n=1 Tax=Anguilla anguilla TaxID=7936 RepID=A0A0E9WY75_ANGAN